MFENSMVLDESFLSSCYKENTLKDLDFEFLVKKGLLSVDIDRAD